MTTYDYIVVGSGCSGAMAAQTLVDAGAAVAMVDTGVTAEDDSAIAPDGAFLGLRKSDPEQFRYLIGKDAQGVVWGDIGKGAQLTPPRSYINRLVDSHSPLISDTFSPLQSLGYGGLGIGWGLQCWEFSRPELKRAGLPVARMTDAYETISRRIGISASQDAASHYTMGGLKTYQPSAEADRNHRRIQQRYLERKSWFDRQGIYLGRTPLALLTEAQDGRKAYQYRDLDFYSDQDESAWRPWITVNRLRKRPNFTYKGGQLVIRFDEDDTGVTLTCRGIADGRQHRFRAKKLVLCAGALNSARIALRSFGDTSSRLPLLCNPYTYIPCLQPAMLGRAAEPGKLGFGQLSMFIDPDKTNMDISIATLYGYQSLMLFRIIRQVPLNFADARTIMRYLMTGFVILGVQHTDWPSEGKQIWLEADTGSETGDVLRADYALDAPTARRQHDIETTYIRALRKLGVYALKRMYPGHGSSVHYAGTLPFSQADKPYTLAANGRLHGTRSVFVADSAGFKFLPARGLTFSILANAHLTAENMLHE